MDEQHTNTLPAPREVGDRAAEILATLEADREYERLASSTQLYADCWATFTGYPLVARWDLDRDSAPLFDEAMRVLALKAAVYELTNGNESIAELMVSAPVDEMVHAVIAQATLCTRIHDRTGVDLVHMTDRERFGWDHGDYTEQCYRAAGWGDPPARYWIGKDETRRRLALLEARYSSIGIHKGGRHHGFDFGDTDADAGDRTPAELHAG
ncbi:hypothetical protein [Actinomadura montaniterrae]|uniref:Uncharacterized protein n=1 Tax=Actinomadura montaniterrae TaxID=1803903 RepID=A0A6L3VP93_9ACTN|nr:hypothetical protein [Actinomadura montaniterrae]KAB2376978.1 hypothetical protein F9B16_24390 [Actinomadura montaniterrae]